MPQVTVFDMTGKSVGEMTLSDAIFGIEPNTSVMHAAVVNYLANQRQGTQSTLTRSEVRGGGIKPWRQKGTGRARQGSIRAPQWIHGGIALGPKPRTYRYSLNKKLKRLAMLSALSAKAQAGEIIVVDGLDMGEIKTKTFAGFLASVESTGKSLVVTPEVRKNVVKSAANIPGVRTTIASTLNVYDILNSDKMLVLQDAVSRKHLVVVVAEVGIHIVLFLVGRKPSRSQGDVAYRLFLVGKLLDVGLG